MFCGFLATVAVLSGRRGRKPARDTRNAPWPRKPRGPPRACIDKQGIPRSPACRARHCKNIGPRCQLRRSDRCREPNRHRGRCVDGTPFTGDIAMSDPIQPPRPGAIQPPRPGAIPPAPLAGTNRPPNANTNVRIDTPMRKSGSGFGTGLMVAAVFAVLAVIAYLVLGDTDTAGPVGSAPSVNIENNTAPAPTPAPTPAPAPAPAPAAPAPVEPAPAQPAPSETITPGTPPANP